jgi:hypothetical protein
MGTKIQTQQAFVDGFKTPYNVPDQPKHGSIPFDLEIIICKICQVSNVKQWRHKYDMKQWVKDGTLNNSTFLILDSSQKFHFCLIFLILIKLLQSFIVKEYVLCVKFY